VKIGFMNFKNKLTRILNGEEKVGLPVIIFGVFQILFIVLLVVSINVLNSNSGDAENSYGTASSVEIKDLKKTADYLPEERVEAIESVLFGSVSENVASGTVIGEQVATIRESHIKKFDEQNLTFLNLIVDLPELKQSYQVFNFYSDEGVKNAYIDMNESIIVICVDEDDEVYTFDCKSTYNSEETRESVARKILQMVIFEQFSISINDENLVNISLGDISGDEAIQEVKKAIEELGFKDIYKYYVMTDSDYTFNMME